MILQKFQRLLRLQRTTSHNQGQLNLGAKQLFLTHVPIHLLLSPEGSLQYGDTSVTSDSSYLTTMQSSLLLK